MLSTAKEEPDWRMKVTKTWTDFFDNTSLHGCKSAYSAQRRLLRIIWIAMTLVCAGCLVGFAVNLFATYFDHPFRTLTHMEKLTNMKLPAISVCSRNYVKQANLTDAEKDVLMSPYVYKLFNNATGMEYSKADANAARNAPYGWGIKKEDFILKAAVRKREVDVAAEFEQVETIFWGRCFVFNGVKDGDTGGELTLGHGEHLHMFMNVDQSRYLVRDTTAGVNVMFHHPNDKPSGHAQTVGVAPEMSTIIGLTPTQYKFLPRPYKSFGDESCVDTQETLAVKELRWHSKYTWWSCVEECIVQEAVHVCKCRSDSSIPDEFVNDQVSHRICTKAETEECFRKELEKTWKLANLHNGSACQCPQPCQFVQYDLRTSLAAFPNLMLAESLVRNGIAESYEKMRDNFLEVRVMFDGMMLYHVQHVPEIKLSDVFGQLGGYMGFFLGASLLTLTELIEVVVRTFIIVASGLCKRRESAAVKVKD